MSNELGSAVEKPQGQIAIQVSRQSELLELLDRAVSSLQSDLTSILGPPGPPSPEEDTGADLVEIASVLRSHNNSIQHLTERLLEIIRRIEL